MEHRPRTVRVREVPHPAEDGLRARRKGPVPRYGRVGQRCVCGLGGLRERPAVEAGIRRRPPGPPTQRRRRLPGAGHHVLAEPGARNPQTATGPEEREGRDQPQPGVARRVPRGVIERAAQVGQLPLQVVEGGDVAPSRRRLEALGQLRRPRQVVIGDGVGLPGVPSAVPGEGPHRLEQPPPRPTRTVGRVELDQGLGHELGEQPGHGGIVQRRGPGHPGRGGRVESADEHPQPAQQRPLLR